MPAREAPVALRAPSNDVRSCTLQTPATEAHTALHAASNSTAKQQRQDYSDNFDNDIRRAPIRRFSRLRSASRRTIQRVDLQRRSRDSNHDDAQSGCRGGRR